MKECITHHHACDCREDKFKDLQAENERLREAIRKHRDNFPDMALAGELELWRTLREEAGELLDGDGDYLNLPKDEDWGLSQGEFTTPKEVGE